MPFCKRCNHIINSYDGHDIIAREICASCWGNETLHICPHCKAEFLCKDVDNYKRRLSMIEVDSKKTIDSIKQKEEQLRLSAEDIERKKQEDFLNVSQQLETMMDTIAHTLPIKKQDIPEEALNTVDELPIPKLVVEQEKKLSDRIALQRNITQTRRRGGKIA